MPQGLAKPLVISVVESRDGGASHVFVFDSGPVVVGRDAGTNLVIDRDVVSGVHGVFDIAANGAVTFCDLGSRNGTLLNGRSLRPDDAVALGEQDILAIGNLRLHLLDERPKQGFGREGENPFAPKASTGAAASLPDETATVSPADAAAARAAGRPAKQADVVPSAPPPSTKGRVPPSASPLPTSLEHVGWQTTPASAPSPRDLPIADAGGTEIMLSGYDAAPHRPLPRAEPRPNPGVRSRAQRGVERHMKSPTVVAASNTTRRLAWVGIAAGAVIAFAVALTLVLPREHQPAATAGASDESSEAPSRAVVPTPAANAGGEPHEALPRIAAPNKGESSPRTVEAAASLSASTPKPPRHSKQAHPRATDAPTPNKVGEVGIMP